MHYELRLISTASGIGYFSCCPAEAMSIEQELAYLRSHPNDDFMHKHLLDRVCECDEGQVRQFLQEAGRDPVFQAVLYEAILTHEKFEKLQYLLDRSALDRLSGHTPLIYIRSSLLPDQPLHRRWIELLQHNVVEHQPIDWSQVPPLPFAQESMAEGPPGASIKEIRQALRFVSPKEAHGVLSAEETASNALARLRESGLIAGDEIRHRSSLSPYGFYRKWRLAVSVRNGRHDYRLTGIQTSYGRGLHAADARASYAMEMVERCASFASFDQMTATGLAADHSLVYGRYGELRGGDVSVLDPNGLHLEVPYNNEPLYWLEGKQVDGPNLTPVLLPAQSIFLFCNLDEISLFSGLGSTGLASGNSLDQAKVSALLEIIERDGQTTSIFEAAHCFRLTAEDAVLAPLLKDYSRRGIHVQFQDIGREFRIPCYKCFVVGPGGQIVTGAGAHLDGKRAAISALTEIPYPYPHGPRSLPAAEDLPTRRFEDLPDYSTGSSASDLALLEAVLNAQGFHPIYVEISRQDIGIPVVKALVPGLELMADFDRFSRVSPRMLRNLFRHRS